MWLPLISWAIISDLFNFQILQETSMKVWNEIQFIFSSGAWSKFADIQWLQKNYLLSFIPFLLFILIVLIFPSKDWKTKKNLSPSVAVRRKHFKYTHIFWKLLFSQSLCHSFQFLKWFISKICWHGKLSKYCLKKGKKNNLNRNAQFFQGHFIHFYSRVSTSSCPADTPSGKYLGYL